jgi:SAM-dependent methyltransferase
VKAADDPFFLPVEESRMRGFFDRVLAHVRRDSVVLDIGASDGSYCPEVARVSQATARLIGVDPDRAKLAINPFVTERHFGEFEAAPIPDASVDVAYAVFVMEHLRDAPRFVRKLHAVLRPGGVFFGITPNGRHYFSFVSGFLAAVGLQQFMLRLLRGPQLADDYHYPTTYALNSPRRIERLAREAGFASVAFHYTQAYGVLKPYFPAPLRFAPVAWDWLAWKLRRRDMLVNLTVELRK